MKARRRLLRILASLAALACFALVIAEVALRFKGFGDPPLHHLDPKIEYYAKQGSYRRHGNLVVVNAFGMRGPEVRPKKHQLRVILLGDSIVFGTYRVGQDELISTALEPELARLSGREVEVLNVACSSWGPENQLAYLERFGTFDADAVVWVLSSHDAYDVPVPGFAELLPRESHALALSEVYELYRQKQFKPPPPTGDPLERSLRAVVLCAQDPVGAWGGQRLLADRYGMTVDVVSGRVSDTPVGVRFCRDRLGVNAWNALRDPTSLAREVLEKLAPSRDPSLLEVG